MRYFIERRPYRHDAYGFTRYSDIADEYNVTYSTSR